jgi:hypothetical protein
VRKQNLDQLFADLAGRLQAVVGLKRHDAFWF